MPKTATKRPLSPVERAVERQKMLALLGYQDRALSQGKALWNAGKGFVNEGLGSLIAGAEYAGDRSVTKEVPKDINRLGKMVAQNAGGYADAGNALWQMVKGDGKQAVPDYYRNKAGQAYQEQFNPSPADPRLERFGNFYADPAAVAFGAGRAARGLADPKLYRQIAEDMARGGRTAVVQDGLLSRAAPQDEALRVAQANAAKPVNEGGLGLRPDNTPEERAAAMGFNIPAYHGTDGNFPAFDRDKSYDGVVWYGEQTDIANDFAMKPTGGNVMPLMVRNNNPASIEQYDNLFGDQIESMGYSGVRLSDDGESIGYVFDPRNIRSRFAAFDPLRKDSSDLMAGLAPFGAIPWLQGEQ